MKRWPTEDELKAEGFWFEKKEMKLFDYWVREGDSFGDFYLIPENKYGKTLTEKDIEWVNGCYNMCKIKEIPCPHCEYERKRGLIFHCDKCGWKMSLEVMMDTIYNNEINMKIESFWDAGYECKLGDAANGYYAMAGFETYRECVEHLYKKAKEALHWEDPSVR